MMSTTKFDPVLPSMTLDELEEYQRTGILPAPATAQMELRSHDMTCAQRVGSECTCGAFEHNEAIYNDFDAAIEAMNQPDYPTTCIHCGLTDTKATMSNHRCTDDAVCDDIDRALAAVASPVTNPRTMLDLLYEIEQRVQEIHRSNSRDVRDDKLVELKELLNAAIVKELSR